MFANISEAWDNDPVKEISNKISRTKCDEKHHNASTELVESIDPNDTIESIQLSSTLEYPTFNRYIDGTKGKQFRSNIYNTLNNSTRDGFDSHFEQHEFSTYPSESDEYPGFDSCNYSLAHIKKCDRCYLNLKRLIQTKVNEKVDSIILDNKLRQLQQMNYMQQSNRSPGIEKLNLSNVNPNMISQMPYTGNGLHAIPERAIVPLTPVPNSISNHQLKEVVVLAIGLLIVLLIIVLILRAIR